jgi:4-hydroxyproline epimerase
MVHYPTGVLNLRRKEKTQHDAALIVSKLVYFAIEPFCATVDRLPGLGISARARIAKPVFRAPAMGLNSVGSTGPILQTLMNNTHLPLRLDVVDSHSEGEPTRCVLAGGPPLGSGPLAERLAILRREHDYYRRAILCEPRGSDVLVGALLVEPADPACAAGVIFFNNAGYLGMCGHGMIGVAVTLAYLGRIKLGVHLIDTPVGTVRIQLEPGNRVTCSNVPSYLYRTGVALDVPGYGAVTGDVAWGGNWFFLVGEHSFAAARHLTPGQVEPLTAFTWEIRRALATAGVTGAGGAEIDHIELFTAAHDPANQSRNFVLCPGKAYDRSPCGTGTSAKMACLAADGLLQPGQIWRQEGILGTVFEGSFQFVDREDAGTEKRIAPTISGRAYVTAESTLIFDPDDPFRLGVEP